MSTGAADQPPRRGRRTGARIGWAILVLVLVVIAAGVWVGVRGLLAASELRQALPAASSIEGAVTSGNAAAASHGIAELRRRADHAHSLTDDPVWWTVEKLPGIGPNMRALGGVAASAATVTDGDLGAVVNFAGEFPGDALKPHNGAIDLKPIAAAEPALAKANAAVQSGARTAAGISTKGVVGPLTSAVMQYRTKLDEVAKLTDAGARASALLPAMLGDDGPRTYLLLVLNNAELRASGGIPGSVVEVTADQGKLTFGRQAADSDFAYNSPINPLPRATAQLFGDITGEHLQDVTLTPRFDQSAELARAMWKQRFGQSVDGVASIDPVALSYVLQATGPVTVGAGTPFHAQLTAQNVVQTLLSSVYGRFADPAMQDQFFEVATSAIVQKVSAGNFSPSAMLGALALIGDEHRLNVWSANAGEETKLEQTTLAGGPPRSAPGEQRFGVYLADGTGSKMDYYLHTAVSLGSPSCAPDGPLDVLQVTLKNGVSPSAVAGLPSYVTGGGFYGVPVGTTRTQVTVYAPPGVEFGSATDAASGTAERVKFVQDGDRSVAQYTVDVKAGQSSTVRLVFTPKKGQAGALAADVTPQVNPVAVSQARFSCAAVLK